jgi:hypothetical protein
VTTLLDVARGVIETRQPTVTERRDALRRLATYPDDHDPQLLSVLVGSLTDQTLPPAERAEVWEELTEACALLTALGTGSIEPQVIAPGAHPSSAYTVATDVLEQEIAGALGRLVADAAVVDASSRPATYVCDDLWCSRIGEPHSHGLLRETG